MCAKCGKVSGALRLTAPRICEHCLTVSKGAHAHCANGIKGVRALYRAQKARLLRLTRGKIAPQGFAIIPARLSHKSYCFPQSADLRPFSAYSASVLKDSTFSTTMPPRLPLGSLPLLFLLSTDISSVLTVQTLALSYTATCTLLSALHANTT